MSENSNEIFPIDEDVAGHVRSFGLPDEDQNPRVVPEDEDVEGHVQPRRDIDVER